MIEEKNRYPHDFKRWHDIRIDEYRSAQALKDEQERKEFYDKFAYFTFTYSINVPITIPINTPIPAQIEN